MKITLLTEGGVQAGFGHVTRCSALYDAFAVMNEAPELIINGDPSVKEILGNRQYSFGEWIPDIDRIVERNRDGIVVVDSYLAEAPVYSAVSGGVRTPVFFDDTMRIDYASGIVINGGIGAEARGYREKEGVQFLLGPKFIPLRSAFWDVEPRPPQKEIGRVLILTGGSNTGSLTQRLVDRLSTQFPQWQMQVITSGPTVLSGKNSVSSAGLSAEAVQHSMAAADLAISGGGQTLYELARCGLPTVAVGIAGNQTQNIKGWEAAGFIRFAGWAEEEGLLDRIEEILIGMRPPEIRRTMSEAGSSRCDGRGGRRLVRAILNSRLDLIIRRAGEADMEAVYALSNDPVVRAASISRDPIPWEDHVVWYSRKIISSDCGYYLIFDGDRLAGQVRFDLEGDTALISISIDKNYRGRGLSARIIRETSGRFFQENEVLNIIAEIRTDNSASVRAFEEAGYTSFETLEIKGDPFYRYILRKA